MSKGNREVEVLASPDDVAAAATELFIRSAKQAIATQGRFDVALSGGSTPKAMFALLASPPYDRQVDWASVHLFWGDERCVPPDHPESNYGVARAILLDKVGVPAANVHRFITERGEAQQIAAAYAADIAQHFGLSGGQLPRFDLIYLGMGPDGHTASLFPHTAALHITDRLTAANYVEKLNAERLTLTAPVLNNAALVAFLVAGADKASALYEVLEGALNPDTYPAQLIQPAQGRLYWLVDKAAAAKLNDGPNEPEV
jgi:6-phosphogluconolactonase